MLNFMEVKSQNPNNRLTQRLMSIARTFLDDTESLRALISCMHKQDFDVYESYSCRTLESAFPNRKMVLYKLEGGEPTHVDLLTFGEMGMDGKNGLFVEASTGQTDSVMQIGMVPRRVPGRDIYLHLPQKFEFKWKGKSKNNGTPSFAPVYAVLIKQMSRPHDMTEGHTYCVRLNQFTESFPSFESFW